MRVEIRQGEPFRIEVSEVELLKAVCEKEDIRFSDYYNAVTQNFSFPPTHVGYLKLADKEIFINPRFSEFSLNDVFLLYLLNFDFSFNEGLIDAFALLLRTDQKVHYLTSIFIAELKKLFKKGLPIAFDIAEERTNYVRGQVDWLSTVKNIREGKPRPIKSKSPFLSSNTLNNQLFLLALEKIKDNIKKRDYNFLRSYLPLKSSGDLSLLKKIRIDRSNVSASKCIELAKVILLDLIPSRLSGTQYGEAFIINYDLLFQDFITKVLLSSKSGSDYFRPSQKTVYGEYALKGVELRQRSYIPDILYRPIKNHLKIDAKGVLDVKNKFPDIFSNADVFQMLFYCTEFNSNNAILVYPTNEETNFLKLNFIGNANKNIFAGFFNIKSLQEGNFLKEFERFTNEVNSLLF